MPQSALGQVPRQALPAPHVPQAELADVDAGQGDQLLGVRREVPRLDLGRGRLNGYLELRPLLQRSA